ncbi:MAG: hypothetical protein R3F51_00690 [Cyanobacteriota/Melainabacteria group bacterium]
MKAVLKNSTIETVRLQLIKVGVLVTEVGSANLAQALVNHPWQEEFPKSL